MTLPRFTSGSIGKLTFSHLNEVFDLIESISGSPEMAQAARNAAASKMIVAKVLAKQGSGASEVGSFEQVSLTSPTSGVYEAVDGGVKSTDGTNAFAAPIVAPVSAANTIVTLLAHRSKDGALCFREVGTVKDPSVVMLKILSSSGGPTSWTYTARVVEWNNGFVETTGQDVTARNGAESATDNTASRNIGVGTVHVTGSTATRQPIKAGTIVGAAIRFGDTYTFSIPNGYAFACT